MSFPDIGDILGLNWRDNWQYNTVYHNNDAVRASDGQIYVALGDNVGRPTSDTTAWVALHNLPSFSLTEEPGVATTTRAGTVIVPTAGHVTVDGSGNLGLDSKVTLFTPPPPVALNGDTAVDPSAKLGFHFDILANLTLTTSANAIEGWIYTMALDGSANPFTVTFGTGFVMPSANATMTILASTTTMLLFIGHDTKLQLVSFLQEV